MHRYATILHIVTGGFSNQYKTSVSETIRKPPLVKA